MVEACRRASAVASAMLLGVIPLAHAQRVPVSERYALIIAGASGGDEYRQQYVEWTESLTRTLVDRLGFKQARVTRLRDGEQASALSTADNVRRSVGTVRKAMGRDDLLFVVLLGHGTYDGVDAKFNLVGPDLDSTQWADLFDGLPGRLVFVNTTAASFPFLERLSGARRVVITATDSVAQRFDTVFPEHFISAIGNDAADLDKNGRVSMWEAFVAATNGVARYFQTRGQLSTERALLDDNGDAVGRESGGVGEDGSLASRTYLDQPRAGLAPTDEVLIQLLQKQAALEKEAEELRVRRSFMPPDEYQREFERLMIALARVAHDVRARMKQGS